MNTIKYRDLRDWYLDNEEAKDYARRYFGDKQPSIYRTGFYSSPSWNWGYEIGMVQVAELASNGERELDEVKTFEVVTRFGEVMAAKPINLPRLAI